MSRAVLVLTSSRSRTIRQAMVGEGFDDVTLTDALATTRCLDGVEDVTLFGGDSVTGCTTLPLYGSVSMMSR